MHEKTGEWSTYKEKTTKNVVREVERREPGQMRDKKGMWGGGGKRVSGNGGQEKIIKNYQKRGQVNGKMGVLA